MSFKVQTFKMFLPSSRPKVTLDTELWNPLRSFLNTLAGAKFVKEQNHLSATVDNVLMILSAESHAPPEIGKALASLQTSADSTSDLGLAAIVIGLSQTKALVRLCRDYVNTKESELAFLNDVTTACESISGLEIPKGFRRAGWDELAGALHVALQAVAAASQKAGTEAARGILQQSRKTLSEFATSICTSFHSYTVLEWMQDLITKWDSAKELAPPPESRFNRDFPSYKLLTPFAADMIKMTLEAESALGSVYFARRASRGDGGLSVESAVKVTREFDSFLNGSGATLASHDMIGVQFVEILRQLSKNVVALSDARVALRLKECLTAIGDLVAKARCAVGHELSLGFDLE